MTAPSVFIQARDLVSRAPPPYPLETSTSDNDSPALKSREEFRSWMDADGAKILLVHAPDDSADIAERIYDQVKVFESQRNTRALFVFDPLDSRYDSAEAMLHSVLAQLVFQSLDNFTTEAVEYALSLLEICHEPQIEDLYAVFCDIVLETLAGPRNADSASESSFTLVLGNLDGNVRNSSWLFRKLQNTVADCELGFKIAITSTDTASLIFDRSASTTYQLSVPSESATANSIKISKRNGTEDGMTGNQSGDRSEGNGTEEKEAGLTRESECNQEVNSPAAASLGAGLLVLVQKRPQLYSYTSILKKLVQSCGKDRDLRRMITTWLQVVELPEISEINDFLSDLNPAISTKTFESMIASVPAEGHSWSANMLERTIFSFRPLTLGELLDLELQGRTKESSGRLANTSALEADIKRIMGGLLRVRHQEVHFGHRRLRDHLSRSQHGALGGWLRLESEKSVHRRIADSCLSYLTSPKRRQLMRSRTTGAESRHTAFECRDDFLSYAVKYWLRHAKAAAKENSFMSEACRRFMDDEEAVSLWVTLYQNFSRPMSMKSNECCHAVSCLAIFAENGAGDVLAAALSKYRESTTFDAACFDALVAAAAVGNIHIVKELKSLAISGAEVLDKPILAAIEGGNADVLSEIVDEAQKGPERIQHITTLLARAASLGHTTAAQTLLRHMKASGFAMGTATGISPCHYACQRGFVEVVDLLVGEGVDVPSKEERARLIGLAVKFRHVEVLPKLDLLDGRGLDDPMTIDYYRQAMEEASRFGRREHVQRMMAEIQNLVEGVDASTECATPETKHTRGHGAMAEYMAKTVAGASGSSRAVQKAIEMRCVGLIDLLMKEEGRREAQDPRRFGDRVETAVKTRDLKVLKLVFEHGAAQIEKEELAGIATRALATAISVTMATCVPFLLQHGADATRQPATLYRAAYMGKAEMVQALIAGHVDVNSGVDGVMSPMHGAFDHAEITRMLLTAGAHVDEETSSGEPAMWYAVKWAHVDVVDELLKGGGDGQPSQVTLQAGLRAAMARRYPYLLEKLVGHCPDASYLPANLLHTQVEDSHVTVVERVLGFHVDPDERMAGDRAPLHCISAKTSGEVIRLLVRRGAALELRNGRGQTPLAVAVQYSNVAAARVLVEHGARVNTAGGYLGGPFHRACFHGTMEMVRLLRGSRADRADVAAADAGFMGTPLQAVLQRRPDTPDKEAILRYLVDEAGTDLNQASATWGSALFPASLTCTPETLGMLIRRGADVTVQDHMGRTALHLALYRTRAHVELFLAARDGQAEDAGLDSVDVMGRHALHFAVLSGRPDLVRFVCDKRPSLVDRPDGDNWTPLLWALRPTGNWRVEGGREGAGEGESEWGESERADILQELVDRGASRLVLGRGLERTWTPMKLVKYYRLSPEVAKVVGPTAEDLETEKGQSWDWRAGGGRRGQVYRYKGSYCDACLLVHHGYFYDCIQCRSTVSYCFKCYQSRDMIHRTDHAFSRNGVEDADESDDEIDGSDAYEPDDAYESEDDIYQTRESPPRGRRPT
ncbi:hypothetical protein BJ875DRAFT_521942 [Amylocarpus encephaloides]|uniref:ZZ-type domain-containing protein n=1 Tax=Amylocarpus encephaloides TaxID=45428 RepID=A0A9P8C1E3_9HELO|nr:hypothetical protein BJ875DRAFT_521942 [Amylocarpus encephaloides]